MAVFTEPPSAVTYLHWHFSRERAAGWHLSDALNRGDLKRVAHESIQ
jgi:hypothetical protein